MYDQMVGATARYENNQKKIEEEYQDNVQREESVCLE